MTEKITVEGIPVVLEDGHTLASVHADIAACAAKRRPLLCYIHHRRKEIGHPAIGDPDFEVAMLAGIGMRLVLALSRCQRCRHIEVRNGF